MVIGRMSSYRPKSFGRPLRRKKSRWKTKVVVLIVLAAAAWFGIPYLWQFGKKMLSPRVVTVVSQEEAMNKLREIVSVWEMNNEQLKVFAGQADQKFAWMEHDKAREASQWLLALELDSRGMWEQSQPMITGLMKNWLDSSPGLTPGERHSAFGAALEWGDKFTGRGDLPAAASIYEAAVAQKPSSELYLNLLIKLIDIKNKNGDVAGVLELMSKLHGSDLLGLLKSPESIRQAASYLLLEDTLIQLKTGQTSTEGEKLAFSLLEKNNLSSSPEMGRILLSRIKGRLADVGGLTSAENKDLRTQLEQILICFRASKDDMVYSPEVMLAIARLYNETDNIPLTQIWLYRAEGAAMTLGVDTPRILEGNSLRADFNTLRNASNAKLEMRLGLQSLDGQIKLVNGLLERSEWAKARTEATAAMEKAKGSKFTDGYIPAIACQLARADAGESAWAKATAMYESVRTQWAQCSQEEEAALSQTLDRMGFPDFYKVLHRELANAYLKQDMTTRAKETLAIIGEEPPAREAPARRSPSRRSR